MSVKSTTHKNTVMLRTMQGTREASTRDFDGHQLQSFTDVSSKDRAKTPRQLLGMRRSCARRLRVKDVIYASILKIVVSVGPR